MITYNHCKTCTLANTNWFKETMGCQLNLLFLIFRQGGVYICCFVLVGVSNILSRRPSKSNHKAIKIFYWYNSWGIRTKCRWMYWTGQTALFKLIKTVALSTWHLCNRFSPKPESLSLTFTLCIIEAICFYCVVHYFTCFISNIMLNWKKWFHVRYKL